MSPPRPAFTVACLQHAMQDDYDTNLERSLSAIELAAEQGASLVVLPELHSHPYFCQQQHTANFERAESIPGPTSEELANAAREYEVVIVGSLFERRAPGVYHNTAVVFDTDGDIAGLYRKMHIPDDPGFNEKFYFTPGDLGFQPIETSLGKLGVLVCWDQWYPEAARLMALAGADCLIYPTAIAWDPNDDLAEQSRQCDAWMTVQRGHAIANSLPVISCNRYGYEPHPEGLSDGLQFWGSSFIASAQGEILAQAPHDESCILTATIDPAQTEQLRQIWPFLRDRRIEEYDDLSLRFIEP